MRRLIAFTLITLLLQAAAALGQAATYQIRSIGSRLDGDQLVIDFTVNNSDGAAAVAQTATLFDSSGKALTSQPVRPLNQNESVEMILRVPLAQFPLGTTQTLYAAVGVDQLPPPNQRTLGNVAVIKVLIPEVVTQAPAQSAPGGLPINLNDPLNLALVLSVIAVVVVLLWVLSVILRLVFTRPPTMSPWQPPYLVTPLVDPNSTHGRRQMWQPHALSDTLPVPCAPGDYKVRKLLIGVDGVKLKGWHVTGLRISQYDQYGRVARSQYIADGGTVKRLDRAVRKSAALDEARAQRAVRSVARQLAKELLKHVNKQSALLPVELELRFTGMHGEVGILFELYGCVGAQWQPIDQWSPEMRVVNGAIQEKFDYTVFGQHPEETYKQFRQRLPDDLTLLLGLMVQAMPAPPPAEDTAETATVSD